MIKKRHLHRRKVPERCFIVYSKSRFFEQADFLRCQDTYLYARSWIYEQSLICYFLNMVLVYPVRCQIGGTEGATGRDRSAGQRAKISKNRSAARRKNLFCALFLIFSKNFSALKTHVFACFCLFCEPLRARAFSLSLKKTARKIFSKKGLTRGYTRAIMETLQGGTPQDRRTASRDARTVRTVSTLRIVVAPADSIPRTDVGYSTPNVHAESRRGIRTCIACITTGAGTVRTV